MPILPGQSLGNYRIIEQIGHGGAATVFKAHHAALFRDVAIKVLPPFFAEGSAFFERFRREAVTLANLRHPNIPSVYDFGEQDGATYIVSEFVEGGTLAEHLGEPMDPAACLQILGPLASALDYAHSKGVIHRDVKPSNVLLSDDGVPLLSDFGIARIVNDAPGVTRSGVTVGTPEYLAPEQAAGNVVGPGVDIYALAVIAYQLLTGSVPYTGDTPLAVMMAHVHDPLPMPRDRNAALSEAVQDVLVKGLAKKPEDRYPSAGELLEELAYAIAGPDPASQAAGEGATDPFPPVNLVEEHRPEARSLMHPDTPMPGPTSPPRTMPVDDRTVAATPAIEPLALFRPTEATLRVGPVRPAQVAPAGGVGGRPAEAGVTEAGSAPLLAAIRARRRISLPLVPIVGIAGGILLAIGVVYGLARPASDGLAVGLAGRPTLVAPPAAAVNPSPVGSGDDLSSPIPTESPPVMAGVCGDTQGTVAAASVALREGALGQARRLLGSLSGCPGADVAGRIELVDLLIDSRDAGAGGDAERALRLARQVEQLDAAFPGLADTLYAALVAVGRAAVAANDLTRALALCGEAQTARPGGAEAAACLAQAQPTIVPPPTAAPTSTPAAQPTAAPIALSPTPFPIAPTPLPPPTPRPAPLIVVEPNLSEAQMFQLINEARAEAGVGPLAWEPAAIAAARAHSQDMVDRGFFDYRNPEGKGAAERAREIGLSFSYWAENLSRATSITLAHTTDMREDASRRNILDPRVSRVGIGVVPGADRALLITVVYLSP